MRSKIFTVFFICIVCNIIYSNTISGVFNTLVIIEEQENHELVLKDGSVAEGVFEALWDKGDFVFFDMIIDKPLSLTHKQLDIKPFLEIARESGADSILLIKFVYTSEQEGEDVRIKADEVMYNLYSLNELRSLSVGNMILKIDERLNKSKKTNMLKEIGKKIINAIYG